MATIAEILSSKIGKGRVSKAYVASQLEVTEKTVENYMRGKREPDASTLVKLANLLKFSLTELSEQTVPNTAERVRDVVKTISGTNKPHSDHAAYLQLLEDNDRFFKTEYHNLLLSLKELIAQGQRSERLLKLNLQHVGNVEAAQKGIEEAEIQEQIGNQIAGIGEDL